MGKLYQELTPMRNPKEPPDGSEQHRVFQDEEILLAVPWEVRLMLWHSREVETLRKAVAGMLPGWAPSRTLSKLL